MQQADRDPESEATPAGPELESPQRPEGDAPTEVATSSPSSSSSSSPSGPPSPSREAAAAAAVAGTPA
eukprot:5108062-Alexandrium_andersonii.AAC.1